MKDNINPPQNSLTRRSFLITSGLFGFIVDPTLHHLSELFVDEESKDIVIEYFRPGDLLRLRFILKNIKLNNGKLKKTKNNQPAYVVVELPPQHVAEQYVDSGKFSPAVVVDAFAAQNSYLVFTFLQNGMPVEQLLDWTKANKSMSLQPLVGPASQYDRMEENSSSSTSGLIQHTNSKILFTTLEVPAGIFLSPVTNSGKTRLFFRDNLVRGKLDNNTFNAELWQNDMLSDDPAMPTPNLRLVTTSIDQQRDSKVQPTAYDKNTLREHFRDKDSNLFIKTSGLRFSSIGLSTEMDYSAPADKTDIVKWHHYQTLGRDKNDEVSHLGYIYPLGLRIVAVQVVDRVIEQGVSYGKHWMYMVPVDRSLLIHSDEELQPDSYVSNQPSEDGYSVEDQLGKIKRSLQFKEIRVVTQKTPPIKQVAPNEIIGGTIKNQAAAFWPVLESTNKKLELDFIGIDWSGQEVPFKAPFIFVSGEVTQRMQEAKDPLKKEKMLRDKVRQTNQSLNRSASGALPTLRQNLVDAHNDYLNFIESAVYKGNDAIQQIVKFDNELSNAYRTADPNDRQIKLGNQAIVYQLDYDRSGRAIVPDIATLETQFVEFTATSLSDFFTLRQLAVDQKVSAFQNVNQAFLPQLAIASVKLPVVKDLARYNSDVLIKYADSFVEVGAKLTAQDHPNLERILFSIQKEQAAVVTTYGSVVDDTIEKTRQQLQQLQNAAVGDIKDKANQLQKYVQDNTLAWLKQSQAYAQDRVSNLFKEAGASLGGAIDPSIAIAYVSLLKEAHYTLSNKVDEYSGQVINTLTKDRKTFINNAKQQANQILADLLGEIKVFGLSLVDYIKSEIPIDSLPKPTINRGNGQTTISYNWNISYKDLTINPDDDGIFRARGKHEKNSGGSGDGNFTLNLSLQTVIDDSGNSHTTSSIALKNFGINMLDLVALYFGQVTFKTEVSAPIRGAVQTSTKTDLAISDVAFGSFLSLVQKLQAVLGQSNFILDISPQGILLSQGLRLPPISTGPFTMSNIALYTGLRLSFTEPPALRFAFGERINPFTLAVGVFGGRGYLGIDVGTREGKPFIRQLDGALEFGGYVGIDLGIAKGEAYLMAGIFFLKRADGLSVVEAYITCGGALSILGLITVSVCFRLGMSYQNGALYGRASLQVRVKMLFFSAAYTLTFEKRISGSESNFTAFLPNDDTTNQLWASVGEENGAGHWLNSPPMPNVQGILPYCMIDQRKTSNDSLDELVSVYDPTLIHGHALNGNDINQYCGFFAL